ncbi:hypothetical protein FBUS_11460 [Fasciolopsis buskii]|uniref:Protein RFT1 homolog n=1 Tax=Fasciolopsis buskii TaxID=27845 RepID=A0A8E0VEC1_9TREM|nr:hypothetical protein FBUS_11460 [Fasciolopsis buski]
MVPLLGVHGFVLANCINMISRISYSSWYIAKFVQAQQAQFLQEQESTTSDKPYRFCEPIKSLLPLLRLMLPSVREASVLALSLVVTILSEVSDNDTN